MHNMKKIIKYGKFLIRINKVIGKYLEQWHKKLIKDISKLQKKKVYLNHLKPSKEKLAQSIPAKDLLNKNQKIIILKNNTKNMMAKISIYIKYIE